MGKPITREVLADANGLAEEEREYPKSGSLARSKEAGIWPEGYNEVYAFYGTKVYKRTAQELAMELGTTARQISKLRTGRIKEAKPIGWYAENTMPTGM